MSYNSSVSNQTPMNPQVVDFISKQKQILIEFSQQNNIELSLDAITFINRLCNWSDLIYKVYSDDGIDTFISTRVLMNILTNYSTYKDEEKSIEVSISNLSDEDKKPLLELYTKMRIYANPDFYFDI